MKMKDNFFTSMFRDEKGGISSKRVVGSFVIFSAVVMAVASGFDVYEADPILIGEQLAAGGLLLGVTAFTNAVATRRNRAKSTEESQGNAPAHNPTPTETSTATNSGMNQFAESRPNPFANANSGGMGEAQGLEVSSQNH